MNVATAAKLTDQLLYEHVAEKELDFLELPLESDTSVHLPHIMGMLGQVANGTITGEKAHRWLGWAQGVLCCRGIGTLEDFKRINHAA